MAHGQDADQRWIQIVPSSADISHTMPSPSVCQNGDVPTVPQDAEGVPGVCQDASSMIQPTALDSLDGCKLQVANLAREEMQLEAELHSFERSLAEAKKYKEAIEDKIMQLDQPLSIDLESVPLSDEDMKVLPCPEIETEAQGAIRMPPDMVPMIEQERFGTDTAELIAKDSIQRLGNPKDVAERNPLQNQGIPPILSTAAARNLAPQHFGGVPATAPLPEDSSVAAILACNRYRSAVSHIDSVQRLPPHIQKAAFAAQHYMSGRQWIMVIKPQSGAAWSLPGVQEAVEAHRQQAQELSVALQTVQDEQQASAESSARQLAAQLWSSQPQDQTFSDHPARPAVSEHLHNFRCAMPAQLNQRGQWRSIFVDDGGLVEDPVALLQEASFTSPWTKRERELMDNMLGEHGKRFACVAKEVGTRSIADCIDRYYKVHLRDEFKPTWRKMARIKRAVDGKNKREEHSKVLAPVAKVAPRPRHSAWAGGAVHAGSAGGVHWPPMNPARLTAAASGTAGDFGMALASLGSMPESSRLPGRYQSRRRGITGTSENMHAAAPINTGATGLPTSPEIFSNPHASILPFMSERITGAVQEPRLPVLSSAAQFPGVAGGPHSAVPTTTPRTGFAPTSSLSTQVMASAAATEQLPVLQIEGLRTQTSSRAPVDAVHAGLVLPSGGPGLAASSGIGTGEHSVGNRLHSSSAHHPTGMLHSHGSVRVSFPGLEKEIATEGAQAVSSMYVPCEPHHSGPHAKGMIAKTVHERVPAEHSRSVNAEAQNGQGMQVLQGDSFQQHQS